MDTMTEQMIIPEGTEVIAADGDKVGKVIGAEGDYLIVEKGFFFPTDYYVPRTAINAYDGDKAYLAVTKDQALSQAWDTMPATSAVDDRAIGTMPATGTARVATGETVTVPVHEEELTATTRPVERGTVRIDKDVVAEERTLEVPVTEERLVVNRRAVDRDARPTRRVRRGHDRGPAAGRGGRRPEAGPGRRGDRGRQGGRPANGARRRHRPPRGGPRRRRGAVGPARPARRGRRGGRRRWPPTTTC